MCVWPNAHQSILGDSVFQVSNFFRSARNFTFWWHLLVLMSEAKKPVRGDRFTWEPKEPKERCSKFRQLLKCQTKTTRNPQDGGRWSKPSVVRRNLFLGFWAMGSSRLLLGSPGQPPQSVSGRNLKMNSRIFAVCLKRQPTSDGYLFAFLEPQIRSF